MWTMSIFLPGSYSIDSYNQWYEVNGARVYDDWYGTGLVATWKWLWQLTGNYMCLYVAQTFAYWTFVTMLLWRVDIKNIGYWIGLGLGIFGCFIPQYVMRDSLCVLAWGIATMLLVRASESEKHRRILTVMGLMLLAYGLWVRINMIAAFMPLVYIGILLLGGQRLAVWKRLALVVGACIVVFLGIHIVTYKIQKAYHAYPEYKLKLLDVTGISKLSGENLFPPEITSFHGFHMDTLMMKYTPAGVDDIYWPENGRPIWPYPNDSLNKSLTHAWVTAIKRHPFYYLENRLTGFIYYLHIKRRFPIGQYWNVVMFWIHPDGPLPAKLENSPLKDKLGKAYGSFDKTCLYDPWFWLLLNTIGVCIFGYRSFKKPGDLYWLTLACIQLSGVVFILSQALIYQHDRDFRYTYWNIFVVFLLIPGLYGKRQGAGVSPAP